MADVLDDLDAAIASGKEPDDATLDRLIAGAQAELAQLRGNKPAAGAGGNGPGPAPDMATITRENGAQQEEGVAPSQSEQPAQPFLMPGRTSAVEQLRADPSNADLVPRFVQGLAGGASKVMNGALAGIPNAIRRGGARLITGNDDWANAQEAYEAEPFRDSKINQVMGGVAELGGSLATMTKPAQALLGMVEEATPALSKSVAGRLGQKALTNIPLGAGYSAAKTGFEGGDVKEQGKSALEGAFWSALLGSGLDAAHEAIQWGSGATRNPHSELGKETLRYDKAKKEGRLPKHFLESGEDPPLAKEVRETPHGQEGVDTVADTVGQEMATLNNQRAEGAEAKFQGGRRAALRDENHPNLLPELADRLDKLERDNTFEKITEDGEYIEKTKDPALKAAIDKTRGIHQAYSENPTLGQQKVLLGTLQDLLKNMDAPVGLAKPGPGSNPPDIENALTVEARHASPKFKGAMDERARTMDKLAEVNDLAFAQRVPVLGKGEGPTAGGERAAAARLSRKIGRGAGGENNLKNPNQAASERQRAELANDPEFGKQYGDMLARIDAKAAYESTRFPLLKAFTQSPGETLKQSKTAGVARVLDPILQSLKASTLDPLGKTFQNMKDVSIRGLLPGTGSGIHDAVAAARAANARRDQESREELDRILNQNF